MLLLCKHVNYLRYTHVLLYQSLLLLIQSYPALMAATSGSLLKHFLCHPRTRWTFHYDMT